MSSAHLQPKSSHSAFFRNFRKLDPTTWILAFHQLRVSLRTDFKIWLVAFKGFQGQALGLIADM